MSKYILAIDQGTTSSRALLFNKEGVQISLGQQEFTQFFPKDGWVEHDAEEIWDTTLSSIHSALSEASANASDIICIGITNQRETTVVWDRTTGEPISKAIVWQDRRTSNYCDELRQEGVSDSIQNKTGLLLDPYFSATKLRWILDNTSNARNKAENGYLAFGTIDSFLLWKLTGGKSHCTDATNASRTMLFNIVEQRWDEELLALFEIPKSVLPEVKDCAADFGNCKEEILGKEIPITGMIGDQQAAAFGQGCFSPGDAKSTYGTGCFLLLNTGSELVKSSNRLLSTVAYRLGNETTYAIEGSIFMAGATIQWVRDNLKFIKTASESEQLARDAADTLSVYLVPAFTGLGAPYWDPYARGSIYGMTRDTGINEIVVAALMSVCYQTKDLVEAIAADGPKLSTLKVDGGMANNNYVIQKLADLLNCEVQRPISTETTALGAAYIAGLRAGVFSSIEEIKQKWKLDQTFKPSKDDKWRSTAYAGWKKAIDRTRTQD
ncbi:MAG: glycerol kinase [Gammaproteobacteria bacterium]|nr:glycerol kinase [Gammaproteobacteria bacterium]|tara:strand:+ start:3010 stop:4494 length:1485 start_codon:yes stop_codon:yes gene_type:complete